MDDIKNLYFIPLIDEALGSDDPETALTKAFQKIRKLGKTPEYKKGFSQFQMFMKKYVEACVKDSPNRKQMIREAIRSLINDLVMDTYDGSEEEKKALIEVISSDDKWRAEYERLKLAVGEFLVPSTLLAIDVLKDDQIIASLPISEIPVNLLNIGPGQYTVRLSNGRVLWEGELLKKHLLWLEAYGNDDLLMAAKTEEEKPRPTLSEPLMDGELTMDVIPDLQSGEIHFSYGKQKRT